MYNIIKIIGATATVITAAAGISLFVIKNMNNHSIEWYRNSLVMKERFL